MVMSGRKGKKKRVIGKKMQCSCSTLLSCVMCRHFQDFFFSHFTLIDAHLEQLKEGVEDTCHNRGAFTAMVVKVTGTRHMYCRKAENPCIPEWVPECARTFTDSLHVHVHNAPPSMCTYSSPNLSLPASLLLSFTNRPIKHFWMTSCLCTKLPEYRYTCV